MFLLEGTDLQREACIMIVDFNPTSDLLFTRYAIDLSRIPLQCVRTIEPERGSAGHFHTFAVFLSTPTSTRCHCLLECGKGLFECNIKGKYN